MTPSPENRASSNQAAVTLWNSFPVGSQRTSADVGSDRFFAEVEAYRYGYETPWIPRIFDFPSLAGKGVLEIGVGLGIDGSRMAACGATYTGIDITQRHLDLAARNFERKGLPGKFILGDVTDAPLPEKHFDVVYSFGVMHHIAHEEDVLRRIGRLLKDDGRFMMAVYSKYSFFNFYMVAKWLVSGAFARHSLANFRSHVAEGSPLAKPVLVRIRSRAQVLSLVGKYFDVVSYHKKGFVQGYLPLLGKFLKPDGGVLRALGSLFGWYHLFILRVKTHG